MMNLLTKWSSKIIIADGAYGNITKQLQIPYMQIRAISSNMLISIPELKTLTIQSPNEETSEDPAHIYKSIRMK